MRRNILNMGLLLLVVVYGFLSCTYTHPDLSDQWDLTPQRRDSLYFARTHHYSLNFNFEVTADSLLLQRGFPSGGHSWESEDSVFVYEADRLVVADFRFHPADSCDSVWVKVARDQQTMGWIHESELLSGAVPDDPISGFIHLFSNRHRIYFFALFCIGLVLQLYRMVRHRHFRLVHFNDVDSFYPTLLCLLVSGSAALYAGIQRFVPDTWEEFYFHPTLNPFGVPMVLTAFLLSVWLMLLTVLAAVDDVHRRLPWGEALPYLFGLVGVCMVLYLFFTVASYYYIGYLCLPLYWAFAWKTWDRRRGRFLCGRCGARLHAKGLCPHCGANNE